MKKLLTSLTGSLVTVALIASCSPATQQPTSSDSAAASSASGIRIVKDSGGKDVEIPADVTRVAPTIGAFSAVTAMLGASGKITAAATSALSPRFKATYPDYEKANPKGFDTKKGLSDKRCVGSGGFHQWVVRLNRSAKVIANALSAGFHLITQRARLPLVGSRERVTRYRHFNAACSLGKCSRARMARWYLALMDSMVLVV